jgi:hypothetical protein
MCVYATLSAQIRSLSGETGLGDATASKNLILCGAVSILKNQGFFPFERG